MGRPIYLAVACVTVLGTLATVADARPRWRDPGGEHSVVAVSRHGNGTVTGPVRLTRTGPEVRLPGGTWVGCRRSCAETLRVETVDIFENEGRLTGYGTSLNECGVLGCLEWRW